MAATSHDFWLSVLSARVWKRLHMLVYVAYLLVVAHIALGALQSEHSVVYIALLSAGMATVIGLHVWTGVREYRKDRTGPAPSTDDQTPWLDVAAVTDIAMNRALVVPVPGHGRVAVYRHEGGFSAVSNRCAHQGGPLGEGQIIDGCITCPWHGWQYRPEDGCSPPPFEERIATTPSALLAP